MLREQADVLERPRDAAATRPRCGLRPVSGAPSNMNSPPSGDVDAGEHVEQRRLAGAVRTDQTVDLAAADREADTSRQRLHAAEALGDAACREQGAAARLRSSCGAVPFCELALAHRRTAGARPGGTASSAPARGRTAACGSLPDRPASGRTPPAAAAPRCSARPPARTTAAPRRASRRRCCPCRPARPCTAP